RSNADAFDGIESLRRRPFLPDPVHHLVDPDQLSAQQLQLRQLPVDELSIQSRQPHPDRLQTFLSLAAPEVTRFPSLVRQSTYGGRPLIAHDIFGEGMGKLFLNSSLLIAAANGLRGRTSVRPPATSRWQQA